MNGKKRHSEAEKYFGKVGWTHCNRTVLIREWARAQSQIYIHINSAYFGRTIISDHFLSGMFFEWPFTIISFSFRHGVQFHFPFLPAGIYLTMAHLIEKCQVSFEMFSIIITYTHTQYSCPCFPQLCSQSLFSLPISKLAKELVALQAGSGSYKSYIESSLFSFPAINHWQ